MKNIIAFACLIIVCSCSKAPVEYESKTNDPNKLHRSLKKVTDIIVHDIFSPPVASRIYAYTTVAAYEASRHEDPQLVSLSGQLNGLDSIPMPETGVKYCFPLAGTQAALQIARVFVFSEERLDKFYNQIIDEYKNSGMPDDVFDRSVAYGKVVALRIQKWSTKDNYKQSRSFPKYSIQDSESTWKPTPPAYMDAVEPHWNKIRTFVIDSASQFRCQPPPIFSTDKKSEFYKLAVEVYEVGKNITKEQEEIARFWDCNPFVMNVKGHVMFATKKISPGGHWVNITRLACTQKKASYSTSSEAYVKVALALADGFIACWDEKYRSLLVRPETYINQHIDENWVPLLQTPPFPDYISGHSVISAAAASVLTDQFGDNFAFTDSTETEFGLTRRSFTSFFAASKEAALSRLYGGIHYRPANEVGYKLGLTLSDFINTKLQTRKDELTLNK